MRDRGDPGAGLDEPRGSGRPGGRTFQPDRLARLPGPATRYLGHADPSGHGLGRTPALLRPPLHAYVIPGAFPIVVIGRTVVTGASLALRRPWSAGASLLAGMILIGRIIVQLALVKASSFLQPLLRILGLALVGRAWVLRRAAPAR